MVDINWNLLQPTDVGNAFTQGMETGRTRKREEVTRNVLAGVAANWPGASRSGGALGGATGIVADPAQDEAQFNALLAPLDQIDPAMSIKLREQRQRSIEGMDDRRARQQEGQNKLDGELVKATGQAALDVLNLPADQRPAAWDNYVDQFSQRYPNAAQYRGKYSDASAKALLAQAGMIDSYQKSQEPKYQVVPEGGALVNMNDPRALSQFSNPAPSEPVKVGSDADYQTLPPGAQYIAPDGTVRRKGGAPSQGGATFP